MVDLKVAANATKMVKGIARKSFRTMYLISFLIKTTADSQRTSSINCSCKKSATFTLDNFCNGAS
jgi:hypothetical protein